MAFTKRNVNTDFDSNIFFFAFVCMLEWAITASSTFHHNEY